MPFIFLTGILPRHIWRVFCICLGFLDIWLNFWMPRSPAQPHLMRTGWQLHEQWSQNFWHTHRCFWDAELLCTCTGLHVSPACGIPSARPWVSTVPSWERRLSSASCKLPPLCSNRSQKDVSRIPDLTSLENGIYLQTKKKTWLEEETVVSDYEPLAILPSSQMPQIPDVCDYSPISAFLWSIPSNSVRLWPSSYFSREFLNKNSLFQVCFQDDQHENAWLGNASPGLWAKTMSVCSQRLISLSTNFLLFSLSLNFL